MKLINAISIIMMNVSICHSQHIDKLWLLSSYSSDPFYPKVGMDYSLGLADTFKMTRRMPFRLTEAIAFDSSSQMLFYTNGVYIANRNHDSLFNTEDFNPGWGTDLHAYEGLVYPQGSIVIPKPGSKTNYSIFYITTEFINPDVQPFHLSMSEVDMTFDNGLGGIVADKKNIHVIDDTLNQGRLTACKHANGRDWWVITHKYYSEKYYKLLVTPDSIILSEQIIGSKLTFNDIYGMAVFSPDGSKYVQIGNDVRADVFDFDRCTGELSNPNTLELADSAFFPDLSLGAAISPNSRFLYCIAYTKVYQYDLWSSDIAASKQIVAEWDSSYLPVATWFFIPQLAPDGKIYISTYNGTHVLHEINAPDSLGLACNLTQHSFQLPEDAKTNITLPNIPNLTLGALPGSPCDTLGLAVSEIRAPLQIEINPNPTFNYFNITYSITNDAILTINDIYGRQIKKLTLYPYFKNRIIYTDDMPSGLYLVTLKTADGRSVSKKLIIEK